MSFYGTYRPWRSNAYIPHWGGKPVSMEFLQQAEQIGAIFHALCKTMPMRQAWIEAHIRFGAPQPASTLEPYTEEPRRVGSSLELPDLASDINSTIDSFKI